MISTTWFAHVIYGCFILNIAFFYLLGSTLYILLDIYQYLLDINYMQLYNYMCAYAVVDSGDKKGKDSVPDKFIIYYRSININIYKLSQKLRCASRGG